MKSLGKKVKISIDAKIGVLLLLLTSIFSIDQILIIECALLLLCIVRRKIIIRPIFILLLIVLSIHGCINTILGNNEFRLFVNQLFGISVSFVYFDSICDGEDKFALFQFYLQVAIVIALLVIAQQLGYILHIQKLYDLTWIFKRQLFTTTDDGMLRASSFFTEPAACAIAMAPGMYVSIHTLLRRETTFYNYYEAIILLLGYVLTYSSVGYISIGIALILFAAEYRINYKAWLAIGFMILAVVAIYIKVPAFKMRVDDTVNIVQNNNIEDENLSSVTIVANQKVAAKTFFSSKGLGTGIGSYRLDYDKYISQVVNTFSLRLKLNREDANSLFLRTLAELGVFGILGIAFFLLKFRVSETFTPEKVVSNALLLYMLTRLFRSGHYFHNNLYFFVSLYIGIYFLSKQKRKEMP